MIIRHKLCTKVFLRHSFSLFWTIFLPDMKAFQVFEFSALEEFPNWYNRQTKCEDSGKLMQASFH